ncbi:uncharacterized protein LACBIDRAFT_332106 [Laccaria bicolor S238N-H82]|uniref:Predicted protein n=1 Tax=Laccaria bicolor (strain S238N-H82 / ATCC MYA-4686) TaxID=486041 RepID=B0DRL4_LACBS|nr:uncharacterized protein LACBIDRAFT_332106 [Laccaria bicolor S238N-H82]EDR02892.1 predicted protein [Laccaria bicolor S238N-H82]|eukprot:XP_001886602.1 predicted protein [Laccaria bicolor S238N-H82]
MYTPTILALRGELIYVASVSPIYIPILIPVTNFVLTLIGVLATCFRLWRRKTTTHIWPFPWHQGLPTNLHSISVAQSYIAVNSAARISILFIVIRISNGRMRYILKWIAAIFVLTWVILTAQLLWTCEGKNADWGPGHLICVMPLRVAIVQLTTDTLSDVILIVAPLRLVWNTKLSSPQKIRIITIFSSTIAMTIFSLNHACWLIVDGGGLSEALAAVIQNSVSLIVCNFSVIIAFIFQVAAEDVRSSYHIEVGSLSLRCKVPSGVPSGTGSKVLLHVEMTLEDRNHGAVDATMVLSSLYLDV